MDSKTQDQKQLEKEEHLQFEHASDDGLEGKAHRHQHQDLAEAAGIEDRVRLEKKLVRKIDARMAILLIIYILNYIDRNNASAARLKGFEADLNLKGREFDTLLSILYVGYILMQIPSNILVQYTGRPSIYLPICITIWGTISILTGITHNFVGALLTRFFLGFVEAAFFPGALFLLSRWYTKRELGLRTAILFCGSLISNAFGPLIAAGILGGMEGKLGQPAWRWLFYIEGALTVFFAFVALFCLPDFPHNTRGFSETERTLAQIRLEEDAGEKDSAESSGADAAVNLKAVLTDPKVWLMALSLAAMVIGLSFNQFFPQITRTLGYSNTVTLLLCAPPFVFSTICAFFTARHSDAKQERTLHIIVPLCIGIVGFIIAMSTQKLAARYVSLFLMAQSYSGFVCFYAWISSSFPRPAMRRSIAIAFINAFSQLGNISGAYIYPKTWAPSYTKSFSIAIACFVASMIGIYIHRRNLIRMNARIEAQEAALDAGEQVDTAAKGFVNVPRGFRFVL